MMIELRNIQSVLDCGPTKFHKTTGFDMFELIPSLFQQPSTKRYIISPLETSVVKSDHFHADFSKLFSNHYFSVMNDHFFFGVRGANKNNLRAHPIQNALVTALEAARLSI